MKFLKYLLLGFLALIGPALLISSMTEVMDNKAISAIGFGLIGYLFGSSCYQFYHIGRRYNTDCSDAFWLSLVTNAAVALLFTIAVTLFGRFCTDNFHTLPFAFMPVFLTVAYCSLIGIIICGLRLKYNGWNMSGSEKKLTWSIISFLIFLILSTVYASIHLYYGVLAPEIVKYIIIGIGIISFGGIVVYSIKMIAKRR